MNATLVTEHESTIGGKVIKLKMLNPNLDQWIERYGADRCAKWLNDNANRHHVLPACRLAGDVVEGKVEPLKDAGRQATRLKAAKALLDSINKGNELDPFEFMPSGERVSLPEDLRLYKDAAISAIKLAEESPERWNKLCTLAGGVDLISVARWIKGRSEF